MTPKEILVFNKPCKREDWYEACKPNWMFVDLTKWIDASDMTDKEKEAFPSYVTTGGYLKPYADLKAAYAEAWEEASEEDRELTFKLPNFDAVVFEEIFGFNPLKYKKERAIIIDGKEIKISEESYKALKKSLSN